MTPSKMLYQTAFALLFMSSLAFGQWSTSGTNITNTNSGNVGIGTTNPARKLHVNGGVIISNAQWLHWKDAIGGNRAVMTWWSDDVLYLDTGSSGMQFRSAGGAANLMRLTPAGNVGVGTTNPGAKLDIIGSGGSAVDLRTSGRIRSNSPSGGLWLSNQNDGFVGNRGSHIGFWTNGVGWNAFQIQKSTGNVGIGTTNPQSRLAVNGTITAKEVVVTVNGFADFVFAEDYNLRTLDDVDTFIRKHKHLPDIPTEKEVLANGIGLGDMQAKLVQKVEELTLYLIEQNKRLKALEEENELLRHRDGHLRGVPSAAEAATQGEQPELLEKVEQLTSYVVGLEEQNGRLEERLAGLEASTPAGS